MSAAGGRVGYLSTATSSTGRQRMIQIKRRLTLALALLAMLSFIGLAAAKTAAVKKHNHHGGHEKVSKEEHKKDGNHVIGKVGKHTVSVDTKGGKITKFHAKHESKGEVA